MKCAPVVLFAYKRLEHTRRLLESLVKNEEARESELHVFIDGPRNSYETKLVREVEGVVRSRAWCREVFVNVNEKNQGVPAQVINTVTKFCRERGRVIVLEDDLVLSPYFLAFVNKALDVYADQPRVMEVTGYCYPVGRLSIPSGFMRGSCGWGWGTWQRAWQFFEADGHKLLARLSDRKLRYEFDFRGSYRFYALLRDQVAGRVGGWDVRWAASIFLNDGLTFSPGKSLVKNIGLDGTGTNTPRSDAFDTELSNEPIIIFPGHIVETAEMLSATIRYFRSKRRLPVMILDWIKALF